MIQCQLFGYPISCGGLYEENVGNIENRQAIVFKEIKVDVIWKSKDKQNL